MLQLFRNQSVPKSVLFALVYWLAIVCVALGGGFMGGIVAQQMYATTILPQPVQPIILQDRTRSTQQQAVNVHEMQSQISQSMFALYNDALRSPQGTSDIQRLPLGSSLVGYALVVTTDGWLVTTAPIDKLQKSYRLIGLAGDVYKIDTVVSGPLLGVSFVKISAKNLRPIQFIKPSERTDIQEAYLLTGWNGVERIVADTPWYALPTISGDYIHSSKTIDKFIMPDRIFSLYCLPVTTDFSEVLGCSTQKGIVSFHHMQQALQSILRTGAPEHSTISFRYIDLSQAPIGLVQSDLPQFGAYLQIDPAQMPKDASGSVLNLISGDIITHVNDEALDATTNLAEAFADYKKGDTVSLKIRTKNGDRDIRIKL